MYNSGILDTCIECVCMCIGTRNTKKYVWSPSLHKMFCARPYTGPLKIKTVRQGPYSKGAHSFVGETHKPASTGSSKNHRNWDSEPYEICVGTVVKGWGKEKTA